MSKYKNIYKLNSVIRLHKPRTLPLTFKVFAVCVEYQPDTPVSEMWTCSQSICESISQIRGGVSAGLLLRPEHSEIETKTKNSCYESETKNYKTETETSMINSTARGS